MHFRYLIPAALSLISLFAIAQSTDFFEIPVKNIQFLDRVTQEPLPVDSYTLSYDMKFNCSDADCKQSAGSNHSTNQVNVRGGLLQTMATKIPKMPKSGPLQMTFKVAGVCRGIEKCTATLSYDQFMASPEPVVFNFEYDGEATKNKRKLRLEADAKSIADIEVKMGKANPIRISEESFDWKKIETEFLENRKKAIPMVYAENAFNKLHLSALFCNKDLQIKMNGCEFYSCVFKMDVMGAKLASDIIVHGTNSAGLCAISGPVGKRYFVSKADLPLFYDVLMANTNSSEILSSSQMIIDPNQVQKFKNTVQFGGVPCAMNVETKKEAVTAVAFDPAAAASCKDKKVDLLYQLELKKLSLNFTPLKMGFPKVDF